MPIVKVGMTDVRTTHSMQIGLYCGKTCVKHTPQIVHWWITGDIVWSVDHLCYVQHLRHTTHEVDSVSVSYNLAHCLSECLYQPFLVGLPFCGGGVTPITHSHSHTHRGQSVGDTGLAVGSTPPNWQSLLASAIDLSYAQRTPT